MGIPRYPAPLLCQSGAVRWWAFDVRTIMCCTSLQVSKGLRKGQTEKNHHTLIAWLYPLILMLPSCVCVCVWKRVLTWRPKWERWHLQPWRRRGRSLTEPGYSSAVDPTSPVEDTRSFQSSTVFTCCYIEMGFYFFARWTRPHKTYSRAEQCDVYHYTVNDQDGRISRLEISGTTSPTSEVQGDGKKSQEVRKFWQLL